jgi:N-acyl-D-aspartate/D-glutamate deacylase
VQNGADSRHSDFHHTLQPTMSPGPVYVRQKGMLRLEDAVRKMTSLNATKLGLTDRGLLLPGNYADLVVFDPDRVIDRATFANPFQYSDGIEWLLVNGQIVLERGKHTGARPGRPLRRSLPD